MIKIEHLFKKYGEHVVFSDLNATIPKKQITCVMGESGCGKTTLFRILLGLETYQQGNILDLPENKTALFQENRLLTEYSAVQNIAFAFGAVEEKKDLKEKITAELAKLNFTQHTTLPISQISGGMARRCSFLRAMLPDSQMVLLDEPFKGLDQANVNKMLEYILENQRQRTILIVVHRPETAQLLSDHCIYL